MYTSLIVLLSLAALTEAAGEVRLVRLNHDFLIDSGAQNYILVSPQLKQFKSNGLTVNGDELVAYDESCQVVSKSIGSLSQGERDSIESIRKNLAQNEQSNGRFALLKFPLESASSATVSRTNGNLITFNNDDGQMIVVDQTTSISKENIPNGIARVFEVKDLIAFSYLDGKFSMKPKKCLQEEDLKILKFVKLQIDEYGNDFGNYGYLRGNQIFQNQNIQQNSQDIYGNEINFGRNGNGFSRPQHQNENNNFTPNSKPVIDFGNQWPFGPENNPFGPGFPFNR